MFDANTLGIPVKILSTLRNTDGHFKLSISPNELDPVSIFLIICLFIARTLKNALGLGTPFRLLTGGVDESKNETTHHEQIFGLPDMSLCMPLRCTSEHRRAFKDAVGTPRNAADTINSPMNNAQLCLHLAALTEPAMLILLGKRGCPIRPLGAVNVRNRFELLDTKLCKTLFNSKNGTEKDAVSPTGSSQPSLSVLARFSGPARRVRRGIEIVVEVNIIATEAKASSTEEANPPTTSTAIFRQEFTMLQFMKFSSSPSNPNSNKTTKPPPSQTPSSTFSENKQHTLLTPTTISTKAPYAWANLCKDYNPIHFSATLGKLLGQPGQLAHGNHAVGICIQSLTQLLDHSIPSAPATQQTVEDMTSSARRLAHNITESNNSNQSGWWMEVRFRRPIVLPATVGPKVYGAGDGFDVVDGRTGKVGVEVTVRVIGR